MGLLTMRIALSTDEKPPEEFDYVQPRSLSEARRHHQPHTTVAVPFDGYVYIYTYIYIYIYMCVCAMIIHTYVHTCIHTFILMYIHSYMHIQLYICAHTYMCSNIHMLIHTGRDRETMLQGKDTNMRSYIYSYRFHAVWPVRPIS